MSEEDLESLITLDDPGDIPEEDTFNHLQVKNTLQYWLGERLTEWCGPTQRAEAGDAYQVTFGQGDWTCTLTRLTGTTNDSMKGPDGDMIQPTNKNFEIELCTVIRRNNGEIAEQRVFYDLVGMPKQIGIM